MRLFHTNLADGATVTASSAQTLLPASNVQNEQISTVWRTGASSAAETLTFEFGSATAITAAIIGGHNLLSTDSLIQLRGSTDNFAASDVLVASFTWAAGNLLATINSTSYRYWRIAFTKASAAVTRDIGRIFLGTYLELTEDPDYGGYDDEDNDPSVSQTSRGGQEYTDIRPQFDTLSMDFKMHNQADVTALRTVSKSVGRHTCIFVQPLTSLTLDQVLYVTMRKPLRREVSGVDAAFVWDFKLEFKQQL